MTRCSSPNRVVLWGIQVAINALGSCVGKECRAQGRADHTELHPAYSGATNEEAVGRIRGGGADRKRDGVLLRGVEDHRLDFTNVESWVQSEQLGGDARDMRRRHAGATQGLVGGVAGADVRRRDVRTGGLWRGASCGIRRGAAGTRSRRAGWWASSLWREDVHIQTRGCGSGAGG